MVGIIAACNPDYIIGVNEVIPWRSPADLRRFKLLTMGYCVIMGRTTWATLPSPLAGRHNIVLTRDPEQRSKILSKFKNQSSETQISVCTSLAESLLMAQQESRGSVWIIGGGEVYREALLTDVVDFVDLTVVSVPPIIPPNPEATLRVTSFPFDILRENFYSKETPLINSEDPRLKHILYERW
jgi:dihydrofolate reductase